MNDATRTTRRVGRTPRVALATLAFAGAALALAACQATPDAPHEAPFEAAALPYYADASFTPHWYPTREAAPDSFHAIPAFMLTDQHGRTVSEDAFEGKITIANFFFTSCPGICPMTMSNMARVQKAFADDRDVALLSHSVTPDRDSVAALQAFAEKMDVLSSKWLLLTGDREQIYRLGKAAYFADEDLGERTSDTLDVAFTHTESFFLVDQDRHIRGIYNGMNTAAVSQLIADVRTLRQEPVE